MARNLLSLSLTFAAALLIGCGGGDNKPPKKEGGTADPHAGHDHSAHGPHEGHLVELGEEEYHAEWKEDDESGKVTVWILDSTAKKTEAIAAESIKISVTVAKEVKEYELPAVDRTTGDKPTAFKFEIVSKELVGQLETPKQTSPMIKVDVNGKSYVGKIEEHAEH
jgi:hypothetical protein